MRCLVAALLLLAAPAYAGASLDRFSSQYIEVGTLDDFGSYSGTSTAGFTLLIWVRTTQTSVCALLNVFNHDAATTNSQSFWWLGNASYSSGITNSDGNVLINMGDKTDAGFLYHQMITSPDWNDGNWHLLAITLVAPLASRSVIMYVDGQAFPTWSSQPFNDGFSSDGDAFINYTRSPGLGARRLDAPACGGDPNCWFDWCSADYADARYYKRVLSAAEINEIYRQNGRDAITNGLFRRWDLQQSCRELGPTSGSCTLGNSPTFQSAYNLSGVRRR